MAFAELVPPSSRVLDLGTGGGVPGLVLAVRRPDLVFSMLDANVRRCEFVRAAVGDLGVGDRVEVVEGRAEELGRSPDLRGRFDVVVSRSFGAPAVTAECAVPFLQVGGLLLVSEPPDPEESDRRWPLDGLDMVGLRDDGRQERGGFGIRSLSLVRPCPDRFPRRVGVPTKRPLFATADR